MKMKLIIWRGRSGKGEDKVGGGEASLQFIIDSVTLAAVLFI